MNRIFATTLLQLAVYLALLNVTPPAPRVFTQSQWDLNRHVLESYVLGGSTVQTVFVGSSLTQRVEFPDDPFSVRNLALSGDSAFSGLATILATSHRPKRVFVEINVLDRDVNLTIIESTTGLLPRLSKIFQTKNSPANFILSQLGRVHLQARSDILNESVFQKLLDVNVAEHSIPLNTDLLNQRIQNYQKMISEISQRGAKVVFFEMPVNPAVANSPRARQIREAVQKGFPSHLCIEGAALASGLEIRTQDGIHLSIREVESLVPRLRELYLP